MNTHKKVYFPDAKSFTDIFATAEHRDVSPSKAHEHPAELKVPFIDKQFPRRGNGPMRNVNTYYVISSYCGVNGPSGYRESLTVSLRPDVLEWLKRNVLAIEYDRISFKIVIWDDGHALVAADHSKILGDYWLAIIDASTVPTFEKVEAN